MPLYMKENQFFSLHLESNFSNGFFRTLKPKELKLKHQINTFLHIFSIIKDLVSNLPIQSRTFTFTYSIIN